MDGFLSHGKNCRLCLSVDIRKSLRGIKQMLNRSETNHIRNSGGRDWNGSTENEN